MDANVTKPFDVSPNGEQVFVCELRAGGARARILSWGATLQDYRVEGVDHSLVLGGETLAAYLGPMRYFGAIVGPVANRIANGQMRVNGEINHLDTNENGRTTLHSGCAGFDGHNWTFTKVSEAECELTLNHPDGLGGFPGNQVVTATYRLDASGALEIEIKGQSDRDTHFSPAFHGYWNLSGSADLSDHSLTVLADRYLPVDADQIPLGEPKTVKGTAFDYTSPHGIGPVLDHNFCLDVPTMALQTACRLEASGITLDVQTDQPGVQIYNGAHIDTGAFKGHEGRAYGKFAGLAIEPQFWPDTPNHPSFPSNFLSAGRTSTHRTCFKVSRG